MANSSTAASQTDRVPWSLFHTTAAICVLTFVWRVQDLYPVLATLQLPILSTLTAVVLFVAGGQARELAARSAHPVFRLALFLLVLMVLSIPGGIYPGRSFSFMYQDHIKTFLLMTMLAVGFTSFRQVERLAAVHVIGCTIYCAYILTQFQVQADGRLAGLVYYDANDLGMLVVSSLPLIVYFLRSDVKGWIRLIALVGAGLALLATIKTGSRGAFLGLIAVSLFMLFKFRAFSIKSRIGTVVGIVLSLTLVGSEQYWEMMESLLHPEDDYNMTEETGRMTVWKRGIGYMFDHPILGVGVNDFPIAEGTLSDRAKEQAMGRGLKWSAAHNSFVQIGAELGVAGLVGFILLLWRAYRAGWTLRRAASGTEKISAEAALGQALAVSLVGYSVAGFFLSQAYSAHLYSLLGIIIALSCSVREAAPPGPAPSPAAAPKGAPRRSPARRPAPVLIWKPGSPPPAHDTPFL